METHRHYIENNSPDTHFACNKCEFRTKEKSLFNTHIISCLYKNVDTTDQNIEERMITYSHSAVIIVILRLVLNLY